MSQACGPLDGITVVTLEHAVAAPFATRQLADLGARVIKVERPGEGDFARKHDTRVKGLAWYFAWINRGKQSRTLDLKHPQSGRILGKLLAQALRPTHPKLIVCDISGYGGDGPDRDKKAYDLLIQAEAGLLSVTGTPDEVARVGISVADISAGMHAYSSILAALLQRGRSGVGSHIDVSMLETLCEWMGNPLYYGFDGHPPAARSGASHPSIYPYGRFTAGGGKTVLFGLQNEREWLAFCSKVLLRSEVAGNPRFDTNAKRSANRVELKALIEELFRPSSAMQVIAQLDGANIGNAAVNTIADVWQRPQLRARRRWAESAHRPAWCSR